MSRTVLRKKGATLPFVRNLLTPFEEFVNRESLGGLLLVLATAGALWLANSTYAAAYFHLGETEVSLQVGSWITHGTLKHLINDGFMALFFFVVGLEIKRELMTGELSDARRAVLPLGAAVGGMILPALIFAAINFGSPETAGGWAIPMATDIAFAMGVLALLGSRVPRAAKVFLASLAIIDDLGAVIVIAVFYTSRIVWFDLAMAAGLTVALLMLNRLGVRNGLIYLVIGFFVWLFMLGSGVHATIAGVAVAAAIPVRSKIDEEKFTQISEIKIRQFVQATERTETPLMDAEQERVVNELESAVRQVQPPHLLMLHTLHPWSSFFIMPLFAFFNAGISFAHTQFAMTPLAAGIMLGLLLGKPLGIIGGAWLAVRAGVASPVEGLSRWKFLGLAVLGGIGFTMSIFISNLAFPADQVVRGATGAILIASLLAMLTGAFILALEPQRKSL